MMRSIIVRVERPVRHGREGEGVENMKTVPCILAFGIL